MDELILVRHGEREDMDPKWRISAKRPYDPGLNYNGHEQAKQIAKNIIGSGIDLIFFSVFTCYPNC